ncbi:VanZ family protein [Agromyces humi]|uniref:VanZ family protein n=1 Tax=Agromyces humi TaxID=1766800 RepID=UPI00135767E6|nr:VanZ family protein [Agromyces humi]
MLLALFAWLVFTPGGTPGDSAVQFIVTLLEPLGADPRTTYSIAEFSLNIALFIPVGAVLLAIFRRWLPPVACAALGAIASTGIELTQMFIPGRVASITDIASNSIGSVIGVAIMVAVIGKAGSQARAETRSAPVIA